MKGSKEEKLIGRTIWIKNFLFVKSKRNFLIQQKFVLIDFFILLCLVYIKKGIKMGKEHLTKGRIQMLHDVEVLIGYNFKDITHLDRALTHSSYRNHPDYVSPYRNINECMEFLGDAVLDFVMSEYLYNLYTDWDEGKLSKFRSKVICEQSLAIVASKLELWKYILVGKGECNTDKMNQSIMADAVEAIIAKCLY